MRLLFTVPLAFFMTLQLLAQDKGSIGGKLTDKEFNNEPLPFANVIIKGTTTGTTSDFDGLYEISNLEAGTYTVLFSYLGYETVEIPDVVVEGGKVTTIDVPMSASEGVSLDEVVVTTVARKDSEVALLLDQKKAVEIKESIGAQQLAKIGVSDAATATTKISGVSSSEASGDVFVRGLGDRYLSTTLNGLPVPSDDVERKNIDLGLFPTRVIENVSVRKTYGVQTTADQASGVVNITSRELQGSSDISIGVRAGVNSNVAKSGVFDSYKISPNSDDIIGGFYTQDNPVRNQLTQQGWNTSEESAPIDYQYNITVAKKFKEKFSALLTASQSRSYDYAEGLFRQFRSNFIDDTITDATTYTKQLNTSGLLDLTYYINSDNKIKSSTFFVNKVSDQVFEGGRNGEATIFEETDPAEGLFQFIRDQNVKQTRLLVTQLLGTHRLKENNFLEWAGGFNKVDADEPNRIRNEVNFDPDGSFVQLGRTGGFQQRKSNQEIDDQEFNGYLRDIINVINEEDNQKSFDIELGLNYRNKERDFSSKFVGVEERSTNTINPSSIDDLGSIFTYENFLSGDLQINELQPDTYLGELESKAAYANFNIGLKKWHFNTGMRFQKDIIDVSYDVGNIPGRIGDSTKEYANLYPSANIKYDISEKNAIRLAMSRTITLPEFKEIAPFEYVSQTGQVTRGNPDLEASLDLNYDLKWEYFPSNGQLISVAAFYKDISDPINKVQDRGSAGVFSYFNSGDKAEVYGLEIETKIDLITIDDSGETPRGYDLNLNFNATRLWHSQDLKEIRDENGTFIRTFRYNGRTKADLQGASDYIVNASLNLSTASENPFSASLTANYASDKIFALGAPEIQSQSDRFYNESIVEKGFAVLDLVMTKEFGEHWTLRFMGKNLLNPEIKRTQLVRPSTTGIETEETVRSYTGGSSLTLGLNYSF
ncbi:MAG: TonB-dependent receptor [Pseudozobellia sp.]|nr:TonB-dependent receptor [Pseudozobellia sp.]MBG46885.1 TonB-dependent receptor [Pseudozobellia sp.]|tara:strand:+ start:1035541 stop:1038351 length:2811 start_codon:yes stop_codon:yes gene_type:complete